MLSESQATALGAVRTMLGELEQLARNASVDDESGVSQYSWGRFAEACDLAGDAVFNVLNVANAYLDDQHAKAAIRMLHGTD